MFKSHIDSAQLLREVKKRPILYNKYGTDPNDKIARAKAWEEICVVLFKDWNQLLPQEKNVRVKDVQKRWKSHKDIFRKEFKWRISGEHRKKKKYLYFDLMQFLVPTIDLRQNRNPCPMDDEGDNPIHIEESNDMVSFTEVKCDSEAAWTSASSHQNEAETSRPPMVKFYPGDPLMTATDENNSTQDDDADRMFLLSLLPTFKKLREDAKLGVRIEILRVLQTSLGNATH